MTKSDVIATWPKNADYPLWRQFIRDNREKFEKVIIVFMEPNQGHNYSNFVQEAMSPDNCIFIYEPPLPAGDDWRNHCVNVGLEKSTSDWILFTEQDFFPLAGFWEEVEKAFSENVGVIHAEQGGRIHPCCIFIKKEVLDKTHRDFSARPHQGYDHFGRIQIDLKEIPDLWLHKIDPKTYKHYNGLSHNFSLISQDQNPNYDVWQFADYLDKCQKVTVELDPHYEGVVRNYLAREYPEFL